jgi:hypothetical protein
MFWQSRPLLLLGDATEAESRAASVPKEFVSLQGFMAEVAPKSEQLLGAAHIAQNFGRWENLGATWAQNPPFLCPNTVFEECKAN